jgi:hypothetical protein
VELGGWQGTAAAHFAAGWPEGIVVSIDHHGDPGDEENKARMLEVAQHYVNMFYFQGWTWDKVPEVRALGKKIDILFIDSWHQYEYAMRDWNDYKGRSSPGCWTSGTRSARGTRRFWTPRVIPACRRGS